MSLSIKTIRDVLSHDHFDLTKQFNTLAVKSQPTGQKSEREFILSTSLATVSLNSKWLDDKFSAFLAEHGDVHLSHNSTRIVPASLYEEKNNDYKLWHDRMALTDAFQPLFRVAVCCANDAIRAKYPDHPKITLDREVGEWAVSDFACCTVLDTFTLYNFLADVTTVNVLNKEVIEHIKTHAGPGGDWTSPGGFRSASQHSVASLIIRELYVKMVARTCIENPSSPISPSIRSSAVSTSAEPPLIAISPRYAAFSNYRETFFIMRSTGQDPEQCSVTLAGPYSPNEVPGMVAVLIFEQAEMNRKQTLCHVVSTDVARTIQAVAEEEGLKKKQNRDADDAYQMEDRSLSDDGADVARTKKRKREDSSENSGGGGTGGRGNPKGDGECSEGRMRGVKKIRTRSNDSWGQGILNISYDYDIRTPNGAKFIVTNDKKVLTKWKWDDHNTSSPFILPVLVSSSSTDSSLSSESSPSSEEKILTNNHITSSLPLTLVSSGSTESSLEKKVLTNDHITSSPPLALPVLVSSSSTESSLSSESSLSESSDSSLSESSLSESSLSSGSVRSTPHITIIARLQGGISGETFLATSQGAPLLVWKEIPLDEDHIHYAKNEVSMYQDWLTDLQGTVVPNFYGAFHNQRWNRVVLLMEYVGEALGLDWDDVSPDLYEKAENLRSKLLAVGVEHNDWQPWHIRVLDGDMRVIDFTHAD